MGDTTLQKMDTRNFICTRELNLHNKTGVEMCEVNHGFDNSAHLLLTFSFRIALSCS